MYYCDVDGRHPLVNYRIVDKSEGKTKNEYFREMLAEVPAYVTGDGWYGGVANLEEVRDHHPGFLFALESNRLISEEKGTRIQIRKPDIPEGGREIRLREFGMVKVFRTNLKDRIRHYAIHLPNSESISSLRARPVPLAA